MAGGEFTVEVVGSREILRAFRQLPREASEAMRDAAGPLSRDLAADIESAARGEGGQAALMAQTVKARRDRLPVVVAGGAKRVGRKRVPAYKLLYGSEFGSNLRQFKPHLKGGSYWFYDTVDKQDSAIYAKWLNAAEEIIRRFEQEG